MEVVSAILQSKSLTNDQFMMEWAEYSGSCGLREGSGLRFGGTGSVNVLGGGVQVHIEVRSLHKYLRNDDSLRLLLCPLPRSLDRVVGDESGPPRADYANAHMWSRVRCSISPCLSSACEPRLQVVRACITDCFVINHRHGFRTCH